MVTTSIAIHARYIYSQSDGDSAVLVLKGNIGGHAVMMVLIFDCDKASGPDGHCERACNCSTSLIRASVIDCCCAQVCLHSSLLNSKAAESVEMLLKDSGTQNPFCHWLKYVSAMEREEARTS